VNYKRLNTLVYFHQILPAKLPKFLNFLYLQLATTDSGTHKMAANQFNMSSSSWRS